MRREPAGNLRGQMAPEELLEALALLARELPGDEGCLWQDEAFQRRYQTLSINQLGITALAARAADDELLGLMLADRREALRRDLAQLAISTLGYQSLPDPDPLLIDNEGPIGHHLALGIMRALGDYFEPAPGAPLDTPAVSAEHHHSYKSRIASRVFGAD